MRVLAPGIFVEDDLLGVHLGAVDSEDGLLLIDSPLRTEDVREWLNQLASYGRPRYLVLLDHHLDRVLGARNFDVTILAHETARDVMSDWPDSYKGGANPIGAEADRLKRITGVTRAVPTLTFSSALTIYLGSRQVQFRHRPGPMPDSCWVVLPEAKLVFIGDAVTVAEPPYLGESNLDVWLAALDELRDLAAHSYRLIGSRDGEVGREAVAAMARLLRKIQRLVERFASKSGPSRSLESSVSHLAQGYHLPTDRMERALLRLRVGVTRLIERRLATQAPPHPR
ncbi:MAG TPA: MBL fold metallo-hydrolase [Anaerolineales bacterium]|nr:MBL fold metallo-hydrolase [Anaerolineales bacterium]